LATTLTQYSKPPTTPQEQIQKLKGQGLTFADEALAERVLSKVGYFRFRGYLYPYFDLSVVPVTPRKFKAGASFEQAFDMYRFDVGLRQLIFSILPEVEVLLRNDLDTVMCGHAGHGFWYLTGSWFTAFPERTIQALQTNFAKSSEAFANHYHATYFNSHVPRYKGMPPFWVAAEMTTLGQSLEIFRNLKETAPGFPAPGSIPKSTPLDKMAHGLGATHYRDIVSWIHSLRDTRNVCAHHGRLWNRNLRAPSGLPSKVSVPFPPIHSGATQPKLNTVYAVLIVLRLICKKRFIDDQIQPSLRALLAQYPEANNHLAAAGIPIGWELDTIWT
jgi:abortive infection bacteriophage resistance protein